MKKWMKGFSAIAIALLAVVAIAGTSLSVEAAAKKPKKITVVGGTSRTMPVGGTEWLSVKVKPAKASQKVTYKSSNT